MGWLDQLFGRKKERQETSPADAGLQAPPGPPADPYAGLDGIRFGRYGDNNKTFAQLQRMAEAEDLFRQKQYAASFAAVFDHIRDAAADNVQFHPDGDRFTFQLAQGSCMIHGVGSSRVDLQACKLEYSIVSPK